LYPEKLRKEFTQVNCQTTLRGQVFREICQGKLEQLQLFPVIKMMIVTDPEKHY
jgi:hypothetical protein